MNPKALEAAYGLFVETGYDGDLNKFTNLINTNPEALKAAHNLFVQTGYDGDLDKFSVLVGVKKKEEGLPGQAPSQQEDTESNLGVSSSASPSPQASPAPYTGGYTVTATDMPVASGMSREIKDSSGLQQVQMKFEADKAKEDRKKAEQIYNQYESLKKEQGKTDAQAIETLSASYNLPTEEISFQVESGKPFKETEFFDRNSAFGSILGLMQSDKLNAPLPYLVAEFIDDMGRSISEGISTAGSVKPSADVMIGLSKTDPETLKKFIEAGQQLNRVGPSEEMVNFQKVVDEEGGGVWGLIKGLAMNPSVGPELMASSMFSMANPVSIAAAGSVIGAAGAVGAVGTAGIGGVGAIPSMAASLPYAMAAASSTLESAMTFQELFGEELQKRGLKWDEADVKKLLEDEDTMNTIRARSIARGVTIGSIDAIAGKVGAKVAARPALSATSRAIRTAKVAGIEAAGGSIGEAAGRAVAGQKMDVVEIGLEGLAEVPMSAVDIVSASLNKPIITVNGEKVSEKDFDSILKNVESGKVSVDDFRKMNVTVNNDLKEGSYSERVKNLIETDDIRKSVVQASPDLNEESVNRIVDLEKQLSRLEGNKTQAAKDRRAQISQQIKEIQEAPAAEEKPTGIPEEISSLDDDEQVTFTVKTLDEVPEEFRDRAKKLNSVTVELRKSILGIPIGPKTTEVINDGFRYVLTGKEAKDYAIQKQSAEGGVLRPEGPEVGLQEVGQGDKAKELAKKSVADAEQARQVELPKIESVVQNEAGISTGEKADKILFLDVNGVIKPTGSEMGVIPQLISHINRIVDETGAKVVISSDERTGDLNETREKLKQMGFKHADKIIGETSVQDKSNAEEIQFDQVNRGDRVMAWKEAFAPDATVVALDDNDGGFKEGQQQILVSPNMMLGVTDELSTKAIEKLNKAEGSEGPVIANNEYTNEVMDKLSEMESNAKEAAGEKPSATTTKEVVDNGVSMKDKTQSDSLVSRTTNTLKARVVRQAIKAVNTVKSIFPNFDIVLHENEDSFNNAMSKYKGNRSTAGNIARITDAKGNVSVRIDINLDKANMTTVAHEVSHAVMLKAFGDDPELFSVFRDRISKVLSQSRLKELNKFASQYNDESYHEEFLVQLSAILSANKEKLDKVTVSRIMEIINKVVSKITGGAFVPFKSTSESTATNELIDFLNGMSQAIAKGQTVDVKETKKGAIPSIKSKSQKIHSKAVKDINPNEVRTMSERGSKVSKGISVRKVNKKTVVSETEDVSLDYVRKNAPEVYIKNANVISKYPIVSGIKKFGEIKTLDDAKKVYDILSRQIADNLKFLVENFRQDLRDIASLWYDGANIIAQNFSNDYGVSKEQAAGIIAALSPQKDWYMNVRLAELVMMAFKDNPTLTDEMIKKQEEISENSLDKKRKDVEKAERKYKQSRSKKNADNLKKQKESYAKKEAKNKKVIESLRGFVGTDLNSMPNDMKQYLVRLHHEINTTKDYNVLRPDGAVIEVAKNDDGSNSKLAWGSYSEIGKAVSIYLDGSRENITKSLGEQHKIRNFYNNIIDPMSRDNDVTMDTHAIAAALMIPTSTSSTEVKHNFGESGISSSKALGIKGAYYAFADGYELAARELGLLPRQVQSITWEAVRGLFTDKFKTNKLNVDDIRKIWSDYQSQKINIDEARKRIIERANGFKDPSWATEGAVGAGPVQAELGAGVRETGVGRRGRGDGRDIVGGEQGGIVSKSQRTTERGGGDGGERETPRSITPLKGSPIIQGATGPDPRIVSVAESYAKKNGIDLKRQSEYVEVNESFAKRLAKAYDEMKHDPKNPKVKEAYDDLIKQTKAQYDALVDAGYEFTFFDSKTDPYDGNPYNAIRDLRNNKKMAVYGTYDGFGTEGLTASAVEDNPMLQDTGLKWKDQNGVEHPVTANDLFRAVHDAFGHSLEGAGFRARGEENAWQAHVRLFTGPAVAAITSETRGQNSWLNYGPYADVNKTAKVEDTVFAEQKTGLMPEWTWTENIAGDQAEPEIVSKSQKAENKINDTIESLDNIKNVTQNILELEDEWQGGVADFGNNEVASSIERLDEYDDYKNEAVDELRRINGDIFKAYRLISKEQLDDWRSGGDIGAVAVSLDVDVAESFRKFALNKNKEYILISFNAPVESFIMRGKVEEKEIVIDANKVSASEIVEVNIGEPEIVSKSQKAEKLSEANMPGYDAAMKKIGGIIAKVIAKSRNEADRKAVRERALNDAINYLQSSKLYENATDVQREQLVRDLRNRFYKSERSAPSAKKILGIKATKITMDELELLKKQFRDMATGARSVKKVQETIAAQLNEMVKSGKITLRQMAAVVSKFSKINTFNEDSISKFIDYMENVFSNAEYVDNILSIKKILPTAKKNIMTKLGIAEDLVLNISKILNINPTFIPADVFNKYMELVNMLGKREKVLTLKEIGEVTKTVEEISDAIKLKYSLIDDLSGRLNDTENKVYDENGKFDYAKTVDAMLEKGEISAEDADVMRKNRKKIYSETKGPSENNMYERVVSMINNGDSESDAISKVAKDLGVEESLVQDAFKKLSEEKESLIGTVYSTANEIDESVFPTEAERSLARKIKKLLDTDAIEYLNLNDIKNVIKMIDNIKNGYISNFAKVISEKLDAVNDSLPVSDVIPKSNPLSLGKMIAKIKTLISKDKNFISQMIKNGPLYYIDQVLGDFKTKTVYNAIFEKASEALQQFEFEVNRIHNILDKAQERVAKSFDNDHNMVVMSKFKMMTYMLELEYQSNPDSKQVNPAIDFLKETLRFIEEETSFYTEKDAEVIREIIDKYEKGGGIDIDKLYKSFNDAEKDAIRTMQKINESMKEKAVYTSVIIRGEKISPVSNYVHHNVITKDGTISDLNEKLSVANISSSMMPSTRAKSLMSRTGAVTPLNLDPFASVSKGTKAVLMDYHLTSPVRTARRALNQTRINLKKNNKYGKKEKMILNAIESSFESALENILSTSFDDSGLSSAILDYISKQGYRAVLASATRSVSELTSNLGYALWVEPEAMIEGIKHASIMTSEDGPLIMNNVKSKVTSRQYPHDSLSGKLIDTNILNQVSGIKGSKTKGAVANVVSKVYNNSIKKYINAVELTSDVLISTPDKLVSRPIWFGTLANEFKRITGQDINFEKIAQNDEKYMADNEEAINIARNNADEASVRAASSNNGFMASLKGKNLKTDSAFKIVLNRFNTYLTNFMIYEYITARTGLMAAMGNGMVSRGKGARMIAGVTTRMMVYTLLTTTLAKGLSNMVLGNDDDDEEDERSMTERVSNAFLGAASSLMLGRDFGNVARTVVNYGIEKVNQKYLDGLRDGKKYDAYKDAITYSTIPVGRENKGGLSDMFIAISGPFSPMLKTIKLSVDKIEQNEREKEKKKEARMPWEYLDYDPNKENMSKEMFDREVSQRIPLEFMGNLGLIPFYKDVHKIVNESIYRGFRNSKKESEAKKAERDEQEVIKKGLMYDEYNGIQYESESDMRYRNKDLYEQRFGPRSDWYRANREEKISDAEKKAIIDKLKDEYYHYTPSKKQMKARTKKETIRDYGYVDEDEMMELNPNLYKRLFGERKSSLLPSSIIGKKKSGVQPKSLLPKNF